MKSLFARILLWFLATAVVTFLGATAISTFTAVGRQPPMARLLQFQLREARYAYESGGRDSLKTFLDRFRNGTQVEGVLTDGSGRDLLTGQDFSEVIRSARQRSLLFRRNRAVIPRRSRDGKYFWLLMIPQKQFGSWLIAPQSLYVLGVILVLSYALALHLTSPLRRLQTTLERFGQGDFAARAGSKRKDELGQLSGTFDQMAERIQTLLAAERRLLQDISHELRSPLARLGVAIELARSGDRREAHLNRIQKEADRLNTLVGELLQVTRAEGVPGSLHFEPMRLDELLGSVVEDCSMEARARGCSVHLEGHAPLTIEGDPELLRRAVENIVRNAVRYSPPHSPVEVTADRKDGMAQVRIRDQGPGVPEESLGRIFDAFYRVETDRNRNSGGVGLGLSIARRAIELHKGTLHAANAHPGLVVEMELPLAKSVAQAVLLPVS